MSRCRITVLRRTLSADLAQEYCVFKLERVEG